MSIFFPNSTMSRSKSKRTISRSKCWSQLLYLDALELSGHTEERPYFYKGQVEKIKAIQALLTQDLTKNYTLEELSARFDISPDPYEKLFQIGIWQPDFYIHEKLSNELCCLFTEIR